MPIDDGTGMPLIAIARFDDRAWPDPSFRELTLPTRGVSKLAEQHALAQLSAILASTGVPLHLLGCGYGGRAALVAACRWPNRVATLALVDPVVPEAFSGAGRALRLDVVRRLAIPTLVIDTDVAAELASAAARRIHGVSRRSRFRLVSAPLGGVPARRAAIWSEIRAHVTDRFGRVERQNDLAA